MANTPKIRWPRAKRALRSRNSMCTPILRGEIEFPKANRWMQNLYISLLFLFGNIWHTTEFRVFPRGKEHYTLVEPPAYHCKCRHAVLYIQSNDHSALNLVTIHWSTKTSYAVAILVHKQRETVRRSKTAANATLQRTRREREEGGEADVRVQDIFLITLATPNSKRRRTPILDLQRSL